MRSKSAVKVLLKTVLPLLLGIAGLGLVIAWLAGVFGEKIEPAETAQVRRTISPDDAGRIDRVHEVTKEYYVEAVGSLKAASRTEIAARIMAPINEIRVNSGDLVDKGEELVLLDPRDIESRLSQAEAALEGAKAARGQAEKDFQRDSDLYAEAAIAQKQLEQTKTALSVAQANEKRAEEAVNEAKVNLSFTSISAPQAGIIVQRLAEPGNTARPGVPLLTMYDPGSLRLEVPVMEELALKMQVGDRMTVRIDSLDPADRDVEAVVDEIVPQAEAGSRSFLVKLALPRLQGIYEGLFARLRVEAGTRRHLCLATAAIQTVGQLEFVDVVQPDGRTLERRLITTGRLGMPGRIEVLSGLEAEEQVLLRSQPSQDESRNDDV